MTGYEYFAKPLKITGAFDRFVSTLQNRTYLNACIRAFIAPIGTHRQALQTHNRNNDNNFSQFSY